MTFFSSPGYPKSTLLNIVTEHLPPLQIADGQQNVDGLATEIVRHLLQYIDITAQIQVHNWARAYKMALEQPNVMIFSITRNKAREQKFKWVGPILSLNNDLWRLNSRNDIKVKNLAQAKAYQIAVPRNDIQHQLLLSSGFSAKEHLQVVTHYDQAIQMLFRQRVDFIVGSRLILAHKLKRMGKDISQIQSIINIAPGIGKLYLAFSLDTADSVVAQFEQALQIMKNDGSYDKIVNKWHDPN
jgi:polar amino acid transport system substrate-binding protein